MSLSTGMLWRILREKNPIAAIFYPETTTRTAAEALDWLLATVEPALEPAPSQAAQ